MIEDLKTFIETYKDLINNKVFGSQIFSRYYGSTVWVDFLDLLEKININPLMRLKRIPNEFYQDSRIERINIPDNITKIGAWAFADCSRLKSVIIGNGVKSIGRDAFWNCHSLASIEIPDSVTSIGDYAFYDCSSLVDISFNGTRAQWDEVAKGDTWKPPSAKVKCSDGVVL